MVREWASDSLPAGRATPHDVHIRSPIMTKYRHAKPPLESAEVKRDNPRICLVSGKRMYSNEREANATAAHTLAGRGRPNRYCRERTSNRLSTSTQFKNTRAPEKPGVKKIEDEQILLGG